MKLKPCPFCGSSSVALYQGQAVGGRDNGHRWVRCECGASGPWKPTAEAIKLWNRRAAPRVKLEWEHSGRDWLCKDGNGQITASVSQVDSVVVLGREQWAWKLLGDRGFADTADEAKAACEQWAQKLVEELTR